MPASFRTALLAMTLVASSARAQSLMVASPVVVIDDKSRTGAMTLINDGVTPLEIGISSFFGYPVTDSLGQMYLRTFSTIDDTMPSAVSWVQAFPRRLVVPPKSRGTVRLLVTPPANTPAGEYWARIVVASRAGEIGIGGIEDSSRISAHLAVEVRSVVGMFFRVGAVKTGLALSGLRAVPRGDSLAVRVHLAREGNAAFVGQLKARLLDDAGNAVAERSLPLGVYYTLDPGLMLPVAQLARGSYQLEVEAVTNRPDVPSDLLIPSLPVRTATTVVLK